jgi:hypothetical protein
MVSNTKNEVFQSKFFEKIPEEADTMHHIHLKAAIFQKLTSATPSFAFGIESHYIKRKQGLQSD